MLRYVITAIAILAAGCTTLRIDGMLIPLPQDWVTEGGTPMRTNVGRGSISVPLKARWQYNAQAGIRAVPLVRDSTVVVATLNGELQAVRLSDGKRMGYKTFESALVGTPILDGTSVILTLSGKSGSILAYNLQAGKVDWQRDAGPVESSPLLWEGYVYVATTRGDVLCLRRTDGEEVWRFEAEGKQRGKGFRSSPSSDGTLVFVGSENGTLYAFDRLNGAVVWTVATEGTIFAAPVVAGDLVVVGNLNGRLIAVARKTGEIAWQTEMQSPIYAPVAADAGWIYCSVSDGSLLALDSSGTKHWGFSTKAVLNSQPLVNGNLLFVGSMDKTLYALDRQTGRELWRFEAEGRIRVPPVAWGDFLLVTSEDKYITLFGPP